MKKAKKENKAYSRSLNDYRRKSSSLENFFSKVIHSSLGNAIATFLEATLFRPIPLIVGLCVAILGGLVLLIFATTFGYSIISLHSLGLMFVLGFIIGAVYEYLRLIIKS